MSLEENLKKKYNFTNYDFLWQFMCILLEENRLKCISRDHFDTTVSTTIVDTGWYKNDTNLYQSLKNFFQWYKLVLTGDKKRRSAFEKFDFLPCILENLQSFLRLQIFGLGILKRIIIVVFTITTFIIELKIIILI